MKLTGKAKEDFDKWYPTWVQNLRNDYHKFTHDTLLRKFYREIDSMQWGVYVDFFDAIGINIVVEAWVGEYSDKVEYYWRIFSKYGADECEDDIYTRAEARTAAIEKANEIYNSI